MKKKIAIITARGNSKRIPRKNIRNFCGRPIMEYSIEAAMQSDMFDEIMVSTEDEEIAGIAELAGAKVPFFRDNSTSTDFSTTSDVLLEVFDKYKKQGKQFDEFCCLYPTAPFVNAQKIRSAMSLLKEADSVIPVVKYSFPPQRCFVIKDKRIVMKWREYERSRSQDLEPYYHDCGQFYCLKTEKFLEKKSLITENTIPFIISELEVQDIDTIEDWEIAELKYQNMIRKKESVF